MKNRYVFCVGMYRSASTWQYGVVSELVERHRGGRRMGFVVGDSFAGRDAGTPPVEGWECLKSHAAHASFAAALARGHALAIYSFRDIREVIYSLAHKLHLDFDKIVQPSGVLHDCLVNDAFWRSQPATLCQRFEEIVADPVQAVEELAKHLGIVLARREAEAIAAAHSKKSNLQRTARLEESLRAQGVDLGDPANALLHDGATLLHWNHIRHETPGWRDRATLWELARLNLLCTPWLLANGYEWDEDWWKAVCERPSRRGQESCDETLAVQSELNRAARRLHEAEAALFEAKGEIVARQGEVAALEERLTMAESRQEVTRAELADTAERLNELLRLGPVALKAARTLHGLSRRQPRLARAIKRLLPR